MKECLDHKHDESKLFRGILCGNCNRMIGFAKDNPEVLRAGAEYLEKYL